MLLVHAFACTAEFPCEPDELLDAKGTCHEANAGGVEDSGEGDSGAVDSGSSDSPDDSGDTADPGDSGEPEDTGDTQVGPPADDGWPVQFVAPYVDATSYPTVRIGSIPAENTIDRYTLAFVVAASPSTCEATWGTYFDIDTGPSAWDGGSEYFLYDEIDSLRASGGDVMVSFGGAANTPIEAACTDVDAVVAEYKRVIEALDLTRVDFDIEGSWVADPTSIERRSEAIAALQVWAAAEGRALHVWYTLPTLTDGLTADGLNVVQSAVDHGVWLDGVNVMTMDYGDWSAPEPDGMMGEYGIDALNALHDQLEFVWGAETWSHLGTTPMIGQNDVQSEVFDLDDAAETREFYEEQGVGMLGFWSINRDHPCDTEVDWAQSTCSGFVDVEDWAFSIVLNGG